MLERKLHVASNVQLHAMTPVGLAACVELDCSTAQLSKHARQVA